MKNICLIVAGGTISMDYDTNVNTLVPSATSREILQKVPELQEVANIDCVFITDIDSTNMTVDIWNQIADAIYTRIDNYDGFVVTHGTDTMAYTASAMSYLLTDLPKPIIFTGSQLSLNERVRSEARSNLLFATQFATMDIAEVCIFFGTRLLRANRSHKSSQFDFEAFSSYNYPILGKAGIRAHLNDFNLKRSPIKTKLTKLTDKKVALIKYFTQLEPQVINYYIDQGYTGIIIEAVGPGNLPNNKDFANTIKQAINNNISVVISSQCEVGSVELETYEVGKQLLDVGVISAKDMTIEAAYTKLIWALSKYDHIPQIKSTMEKSIAGELTEFTSDLKLLR
jgi:L-asparaginase